MNASPNKAKISEGGGGATSAVTDRKTIVHEKEHDTSYNLKNVEA